jgi:hypothetical protein
MRKAVPGYTHGRYGLTHVRTVWRDSIWTPTFLASNRRPFPERLYSLAVTDPASDKNVLAFCPALALK